MSTLIKLLGTLCMINIFMYLGVNFAMNVSGESLNTNYNFHFTGDLIDSYMGGYANLNQVAQYSKDNYTAYGVELNKNYTIIPEQESGESIGTGGINFLDSLRIVYAFVKTLGNIIIAPLTLFFNFRMPVFIGLIVGIPYFFVLILSVMAFIRGASD